MNKKLIKSIVSIACGLGVVATIPLATTSCGYSQEKINLLPEEVYKFSETLPTLLQGFTDDFINNSAKYSDYNTMKIPASVTTITENAFNGKIPPFVTKIIFPVETKETISLGIGTFASNPSLKSIVLSGNLKTIKSRMFNNCSNLSSITWDSWSASIFDNTIFSGVASTGIVKVTHPIDANHDSKALLQILQEEGGLPKEGWTAA